MCSALSTIPKLFAKWDWNNQAYLAVRVGAAELAATHWQTLAAEPVAVLVLRAVRVDQAL